MRKAIPFLLIIAWSVTTYGQALNKEKSKATISERSKTNISDKAKPVAVEKGNPVTDKSKPIASKDTLQTEKPVADSEIEADSMIVAKGKFKLYKKNAHASYYADKFNGKRTSSGKRFDNKKYSAAHRKFPFGTILRITNEENGKSVLVEVLDRGPFSRGREIDLTKKAFMEIVSNKNSGSANVKIEVMD